MNRRSVGSWGALAHVVSTILVGLARSSVFAGCALIVPACVALVPVLAAWQLLGSPWAWSNPWSWLGLVLIAVPVTLALAHPVAVLFRRLILRWTGAVLDTGFRQQPEPIRLSSGYWWNGSSYERTRRDAVMDLRMRRVREPAYWREVRWVLIAAIAVVPVSAASPAAFVGAVIAFAVATPSSTVLAIVLLLLGAAAAPRGWRAVIPLARRWLAAPEPPWPSAADWRSQRADLSAAHDAEIRRIERDLHDGAQARLVAVGLDLAVAERLIRSDPDRAEAMLRAARDGTRASLNDLRDLVHGVYPPVLVERGLVPAIRAAALDSPVDVAVEGPDELTLPSPVAAALYFAVCELLANVAKHAHAATASVTVTRDSTSVQVVVRDSGPGGALLRPGGGLDGIRRRIAAFDATLAIHSPAGGPTRISLKAPCA